MVMHINGFPLTRSPKILLEGRDNRVRRRIFQRLKIHSLVQQSGNMNCRRESRTRRSQPYSQIVLYAVVILHLIVTCVSLHINLLSTSLVITQVSNKRGHGELSQTPRASFSDILYALRYGTQLDLNDFFKPSAELSTLGQFLKLSSLLHSVWISHFSMLLPYSVCTGQFLFVDILTPTRSAEYIA